MLRYLFCLCFFLFTFNGFANTDIDTIVKKAQNQFGAEVYAGWGFARDIVSHLELGRDLSPRDFDLAIIGSKLNRKQAEVEAAQMGQIVKTLTAYEELLDNRGKLYLVEAGFIIIVEIDGRQFDFKFFETRERAHTRGALNVEAFLFKFNSGGLQEVIENASETINEIKELQRTGLQEVKMQNAFVSDPYGGIGAWIEGRLNFTKWAKVMHKPFEFAIRATMIFAKRGFNGPLPEPMRSRLIHYIEKYGKTNDLELGIVKRAVAHKRSQSVFKTLYDLGSIQSLASEKRFQQHNEIWSWLQQKTAHPALSCYQMFAF